jgi:hypothetical protein
MIATSPAASANATADRCDASRARVAAGFHFGGPSLNCGERMVGANATSRRCLPGASASCSRALSTFSILSYVTCTVAVPLMLEGKAWQFFPQSACCLWSIAVVYSPSKPAIKFKQQ